MDERIGILHVSDIHASVKCKEKIASLVKLLINDVKHIMQEYKTPINIICVSGDLINSGDNSEEELEIALDDFLQPLLEALQLKEESVYLVAGNHEVKRSLVVNYLETGLEKTLVTEDEIERFMSDIRTEAINRIGYFDEDFASMFGPKTVWENPLGRAYLFSMGTLTIGISCLNSAWRSTGVGEAEKRKMVLGRKQIIDSYQSINSADIKICITHHPFDWLVDEDKTAVEKCISQYDIVLTGHIHESDTKLLTSFNGQTLYSTCGKFDRTSDIYNGYSILSIEPCSKKCDVILRQYYDFPRNCFDKALCVAEEGIFSVSLAAKDDKLSLAYDLAHAIEVKFSEYANSYFVSNVVAGRVEKSFDESFIVPELSRYSEYEKETEFESEKISDLEDSISLFDICKNKQNYFLLGKKEIGKTTILHYITKYCLTNFNSIKTVPIVLETPYIDYAGRNVILRAIHKFINEYCDSSFSISIDEIKTLLDFGLFTIMFDDFESVDNRKLSKINEFISEYPDNRYIFSAKENITSNYIRNIEFAPCCDYEIAHICALTKRQIRATAIKSYSSEDCSALVDRIMLCFKKTTLPKTPFVLSLMLSVCEANNFSPINEAVMMEQFMESLLEKSSPEEAYSRTFDFRVKEDFLIELVTYMNVQNCFRISIAEFETVLYDYHKKKGFIVDDTKFNTLFFEKGVLVRTQNNVTFRYNCMIEYYLAKKAGQCSEFLQFILSDRNYLNYSNELMYYTGLFRQNDEVVKKLQQDLYLDFESLSEVLSELENYNIGIDISIPTERFAQRLSDTKLSQEQSDIIQDTKDFSESQTPEEINKVVTHESMDSFISTLLVYGTCLKNLELLSVREKEVMYNDYISGLCIMLGIFKRRTEEFFNNEVIEMEQNPEEHSADDVQKYKEFIQDVLKISTPIVLQNIALENIGTTKLKSIIESTINNKDSSDFTRFFSVFLFCDLHLSGLKKVLGDYCATAKNKSLLTIIFFKLLYYYRYRCFSPSLDPFFEDILAEINAKLGDGNKRGKNRFIADLKKKKMLGSV